MLCRATTHAAVTVRLINLHYPYFRRAIIQLQVSVFVTIISTTFTDRLVSYRSPSCDCFLLQLSESINSMFQWYKDSRVCYFYLSDLGPSDDIAACLGNCRWIRRGWTLQELIAPDQILFFDRE